MYLYLRVSRHSPACFFCVADKLDRQIIPIEIFVGRLSADSSLHLDRLYNGVFLSPLSSRRVGRQIILSADSRADLSADVAAAV